VCTVREWNVQDLFSTTYHFCPPPSIICLEKGHAKSRGTPYDIHHNSRCWRCRKRASWTIFGVEKLFWFPIISIFWQIWGNLHSINTRKYVYSSAVGRQPLRGRTSGTGCKRTGDADYQGQPPEEHLSNRCASSTLSFHFLLHFIGQYSEKSRAKTTDQPPNQLQYPVQHMYTMWVPNNPYLHYKRGNNTVKQPQQVKLKGSDRLYICLLAVLQPKLPLPGTLIVLFSYCITTCCGPTCG